MWYLVKLFAMVGRGAAISEVMGSLSTFAMSRTVGQLTPKMLLKNVTGIVNQFTLDSLKTKALSQVPFYQTIKKINDTSQALKSYKRGEGLLRVTKDYGALLRGDLKNFYNLKCVQNIRKKKINIYNSLKSVTYKNEYGFVPREEYQKKGYNRVKKKRRTRAEYLADLQKQKEERILRNELVRRKHEQYMQKVKQSYSELSNYGFSEKVIDRLQKAQKKKDKIYLTNQGSNLRIEKKLTRLNDQLGRMKDYTLQQQREMLVKGIKYKDFIKNFDPEAFGTIGEQVLEYFEKEWYSVMLSQEDARGKFGQYNINNAANLYNRYFKNMDARTLKAMQIYLNPEEFYKQRYGTRDIKSYMKSMQNSSESDGDSGWISWAVWVPYYVESDKGFFMVKLKNTSSRRNPKLLYCFGEFWGTPSITKAMFNEIFSGSSMGKNFWKSYFRKFGRAALKKSYKANKYFKKKGWL